MINPVLDLPEVEDKAIFNVDAYIGGDKMADAKLTLSDIDFTLKPEQGDERKVKYSQVVQCKFVYNLHVDEIPDEKYKNKIFDGNYVPVSDADVQNECCIFFK